MTAEKILTIPPDTNGGWPGNYNWFGANKVEIIGRYTSGNKDTSNLENQKVFKHISDSDWMTDIPKYNIGQQDNNQLITANSWFLPYLSDFEDLEIVIEVYNLGPEDMRQQLSLVQDIIN